MKGWRWWQSIRLPFGLRANLNRGGVGWSWGIGFIRFGRSAYGTRWVSLGIPGTGLHFVKHLGRERRVVARQVSDCPADARRLGGKPPRWHDLA